MSRSNDVTYPFRSSDVMTGRLIGSARLWRFCTCLILMALLIQASTGVLLASAPELQVSVTDTRTTTVIGELLTYTVRVGNTSSSPLTNVRARIKISPNVTFVTASDSPTPPAPGGDTYEWTISSLPANTFVFRYLSITINSQLASGTVITTNAEADQTGDPTPNIATPDTTTVDAPAVTLTPSNLAFGDQRVGTSSSSQPVTLTNSGNQPLDISTISLSGPFSQTGTCSTSLPVGGSCTLNVVFAPTAFGAASGTLSVNDNAIGSPHTVALTGNGTQPAVQLTTHTISFGSLRVGTPSSPQPVTLTNSGTAPLLIASITPSGDFAQTNTCPITPQTLLPQATCTINVTFTPTTTGVRSGAISIAHDAPSNPDTIILDGTGTAPVATVAPTSLAFGDQGVLSSSGILSTTLSNTGDATLIISNIAISGDFTKTTTCTSTLAPGTTCRIDVTFSPTVIGPRIGTLTIFTDSTGSPHTVGLTGNGLAATVQISPPSINFGGVQVNQTSITHTVTITNVGNTGLTFTSIVASSKFTAGATTCPTSPTPLAAGQSCIVDVTFAPTTPGAQTGTLTFIDSALGGPQTVGLSGMGLLAVLSVNPSSLTFGDRRVNTSSSAQFVTLVNTGNQNLTINSRSISGGTDFSIDAGTTTCTSPMTLTPGDSCVIGVLFKPTATGARSDALTITDTTPVANYTVPLSGRGTDPQASLSAASLSFGSQQVNTTSTVQNITLTNTGTGALAISSISISGNFAQTNTCGSSLAESAVCTISVTFRPTAIDVRTGTLTITDDAANSPQTVSLTGVGIQPVLSLSPTSLDFGGLNVNMTSAPQDVTLTNTGSQPLLLTGITTSGNFSQTNQCPSTLATGEGCTVSVTFTPTAVGPTSGALMITSNAPSSPHTLTMTGIGNGSAYHSVPAPGAIPMSGVIGGSNTISITISNDGNQELTVTGPAETVQPPFKIVSDSAPQVQADGGDRVIVIECAPTSVGPFTQKLTFTSNDPINPQAVYTLVCAGTAGITAGYSSSPSPGSAWPTGAAQVGGSTSSDMFISENGTAALIVGLNGGSAATAITGPNASDFAISAPTNFPIAIPEGGAPQRLTLRCQPSGSGTRTATLTLTTNDPTQPTVSYALSCTGQATAGQHMVYLPKIIKAATVTLASQPDLIASLNVSATQVDASQPVGVSVTITNQGNASASEFWVDLYINPSTPPSATNQPWNKRCQLDPCYGIAWYVTQSIAPGESIMLTSTSGSYYADNTIWNGVFAPGTSDLYAYVDSWNPTVAEGAVSESDETNNRAELHGLTVTGPAAALSSGSSPEGLPIRPVHPNQ